MGLVRVIHPRLYSLTHSHLLADRRSVKLPQVSKELRGKIWAMRSSPYEKWFLISSEEMRKFTRMEGFKAFREGHPNIENLTIIRLRPNDPVKQKGRYWAPSVRMVSYDSGENCEKCHDPGNSLAIQDHKAVLLCNGCFRLWKLSVEVSNRQ